MDRQNKIVQTFNEFSGRNLAVLDSFYSEQIEFCDPVKRIVGLESLKKYYDHIYENVDSIRFDFKRFVESKNAVTGEWVMTLKVKKMNSAKPYEVKGCSVFEFDDKNLVQYHRDYLDLGEMVYEKIPVLGSVIKAIKAKL